MHDLDEGSILYTGGAGIGAWLPVATLDGPGAVQAFCKTGGRIRHVHRVLPK